MSLEVLPKDVFLGKHAISNLLLTQESSTRAIDISKLTTEQHQDLPTGNLKCERHLSVFDKRSEVAISAETENSQLSLSETMSCCTEKLKTQLILL